MPFKPVDQAIKIIVGPAIDDTDFKSREETLTYDQAGMEVDIILEKADGAVTTTAVTPTTGGDYDWAHTDQGYYELEIPASGGASFNNAEEGTIRAVVYCTGVLPFGSVAYDVIPEKVWNSLIEGSDNLETDIVAIGGVAQSATDLKDFADTGYDPSTHKVQGVVLADTVTTLTNKTGFSLSVAGITSILTRIINVLYKKTVTARHGNDRPSAITVDPSGTDETFVTTTLDGDNIDTETL